MEEAGYGSALVGVGKHLYQIGGFSTDIIGIDLNERYDIPNLSYEDFEMEVEDGIEYDIEVKKEQ